MAFANSLNIVGEIPAAKEGEVVMIGAHFDSWQAHRAQPTTGGRAVLLSDAFQYLK